MARQICTENIHGETFWKTASWRLDTEMAEKQEDYLKEISCGLWK
jgi:hypothetical protein